MAGSIALPRHVIKETSEIAHPDVPGAWASGVRPLVVHPLEPDWEHLEPALMFRHRLRIERAVAVPRDRQLDVTDISRNGLARRPVARVAAPAAGRVVWFVAEMIGELDLEAGLQHLADHRGQQPVVAREVDPLPRVHERRTVPPIRASPACRLPRTARYAPTAPMTPRQKNLV